MVDVAIHDTEERIAARMRQATLNRENQDHEMLRRDSRLSSKGESAVSTAKKLGISRQDVDAIVLSGTYNLLSSSSLFLSIFS